MTDAEIIPFGAGVRILRGPDVEATRLARISLLRRQAYRRAVWGGYHKADLAMFGPAEQLMRDGPGAGNGGAVLDPYVA